MGAFKIFSLWQNQWAALCAAHKKSVNFLIYFIKKLKKERRST